MGSSGRCLGDWGGRPHRSMDATAYRARGAGLLCRRPGTGRLRPNRAGEWRRLSRSGTAWRIDDVAISRVERVSADLSLCYTRGLLRDHRTSADVGAYG